MPQLQEMIDQLASTALIADPNDLASLVKLHDSLAGVPQQVSGDATLDSVRGGSVRQTASDAAALVEKIILRDVKDAAAALISVSEQIGQLQELISGASTAAPSPAGAKKETTPSASTHDAAPVAADTPIKAEDLLLVADFINEAGTHIEAAEAALLDLGSDPTNQDLINAIFRSFHTMKGVAGFLNLREISQLTHAAENLLDLARKGKLTISGALLDLSLEALDATKTLLRLLTDALDKQAAPASYPALPELLVRLRIAAEGGNPAAASQAVVAAPAKPAEAKPAAAVAPTGPVAAAATPAAAAPAAQATAAHKSDTTVKVTTDRLDALINMVGELVIAEAMVTQDLGGLFRGNQRLARNASRLGKITRELQDLTMGMRMVPIQGVFQKMARLVRDLANKSGKQIELVLTGGETELDRNLVEALADPLVHMVRNSADHGIEGVEDRTKAGKSPTGRIELKAYHQAGSVVIEISDDGRGLNKKRILEKARAAGIVKDDAELLEQDIFRLIFHAGLSTAEKITDVSGRGVGMDVVRKNVEALRGRIDIQSAEGKGSTFTIRLPLTLAVIDGLIVKVGAERYILPITSIEQSMRPKAESLSTVQNRAEICMVRGNTLPLYRLHRLFGVTPRTEDPCEALIVIVQDNDRRCCLMVDELLGQQQVVIKSLDNSTGAVPGISGGAILGDGTISLILDVPGLMDLVAAK
jgi:two-component system, chemotaxis family, sensor kinase CheA